MIRFGRRFRMRPRLPKLWAAFGPSDAENLHGEGPEFENMRTKFGFVGPELFKKFERKHLGQILYPLDWVSDQLKMSLGIYVELKGFPKCQLFCARKLPDDLCGFVGACEFDFFDSTQRDFWTIRASSAQQSPALCEA